MSTDLSPDNRNASRYEPLGGEPGRSHAQSQPWRTLGTSTIAGGAAHQQLPALLETCLPDGLPSDSLREAIDQALLEAIARRQGAAGSRAYAAQVIVSTLEPQEPPHGPVCGWSFFVLVRPAPLQQADEAAHDVIELRLYRE